MSDPRGLSPDACQPHQGTKRCFYSQQQFQAQGQGVDVPLDVRETTHQECQALAALVPKRATPSMLIWRDLHHPPDGAEAQHTCTASMAGKRAQATLPATFRRSARLPQTAPVPLPPFRGTESSRYPAGDWCSGRQNRGQREQEPGCRKSCERKDMKALSVASF